MNAFAIILTIILTSSFILFLFSFFLGRRGDYLAASSVTGILYSGLFLLTVASPLAITSGVILALFGAIILGLILVSSGWNH